MVNGKIEEWVEASLSIEEVAVAVLELMDGYSEFREQIAVIYFILASRLCPIKVRK